MAGCVPCPVLVCHPQRIVAEAVAATLRSAGVAGTTWTTDRAGALLHVRQVFGLVVLAAAADGEVGEVTEALAHRGVTVPLMTCRESISVAGVVADLLDGASGVAALTSSRPRFAAVGGRPGHQRAKVVEGVHRRAVHAHEAVARAQTGPAGR